jgi:hypothetical protein
MDSDLSLPRSIKNVNRVSTYYGTVSDESGKAIQAEIFLMKSGIVIQKTKSDVSTGDYEFPVLPGIYEINAVASGRTPTWWHGSVSADTKVDVSLVL